MILINELDLEKIAHDKNMSRNDIVEALGITRKTLWRWYCNKNHYHLPKQGIMTDRLYDILKLLGMELVIMEKTEYETLQCDLEYIKDELEEVSIKLDRLRKDYL